MSTKRPTIKDISNALGVSLALINRALNNKPGVSADLRKKILETADELGYKVNKVAQSMARATINIGLVIPNDWSVYFDVLRDGLNKELDRLLDYNVESKYYIVNNIHSNQETINCLKQCIKDKVTGIILCDAFPTGTEKISDELKAANIPIIAIGKSHNMSDYCICSIQVDAYQSGMLAAEMLSFITGSEHKEKNVFVFVGSKDNVEHSLKINGFTDMAKKCNLNIAGVYETHDDEQITVQLTKKILSEYNNIDGIYIATANSPSVCRVIENSCYKIKIVSTDIYDEIAEYIERGIIQTSIFQNPEKLGQTAVNVLYRYLADHKCPEKDLYISPHIIVKSNLNSYFDKKN